MPSEFTRSRRSILTGATTLVAAFAGCATGQTDPGRGTDGTSRTTSTDSTSSTTTTTMPPTTAATSPDTSTPCPDRHEKTLTYDPDAACPGYRLPDLTVHPREGDSTIDVRIVRLVDGVVRLDETIESEGTDPIAFQDPITDAGPHRITIAVVDGPTGTYEWDVPEGEAETDAYGVSASVEESGISFGVSVN